MKKLRDIKLDPQNEEISLRPDDASAKKERLSKKYSFAKKQSPIKAVNDISKPQEEHYIYIKGKKFTPPRFLGNLLKVGFVGFFIIILINTVNVYYTGKKLQEAVSAQAYEGYSFLIDAGKSATKIQFDQALETFEKASDNFAQARDQLWFITTDKSFYVQSDNVGYAVSSLLEAGKHFAKAGSYFLDALEEFNKIPLYFVSKNSAPDEQPPSVTEALKLGLHKTDLAIAEITQASDIIAKVNEDTLPDDIALRVKFAKSKIEEVSATLQSTSEHFPAILKLLGDRYPHRYLILLQNNNEIRAAGGFIGSYAIVDINDGYIEKLEVHDVYDIDNKFGGYIKPPEEMKDFTTNWRFRDSNYSQDFPTSAQSARWLLQKEGGPSVDTVIAINQGLLRDMLEITGPVQVGSFGALNSENYNLLLSYVIEGKIWGEEDPKHILKVFVPAFKEAILKEENIGSVASKLYKAIQQKHITLYSGDAEIQGFFDAMDLSGRVHIGGDKEDYLSVINSSVGGTKSDGFIEEEITHDTYIDEHGNLTDEVVVRRSHLWNDDIYYRWRRILQSYGLNEMPDQLIDILGRGRNETSMRIYVPADSVLLESNGADVTTKYDTALKKTYFQVRLEVRAGESKEIRIKYRLPFTLDFTDTADSYQLVIEKQPGSRGSIFTKTVHSADTVHNLSVHPDESRIDSDDKIIYPTNLVYDRYFSGLWGK